MTAFILDASVALAWVLPERDSERCAPLFVEAATRGVAAPSHWLAEVGNVLLVNERRGRVAPEEHALALERLAALPAARDTLPWLAEPALTLARRHRLTLYDALYLELAARRALPLATLDAALRRAAAAEGVALLP